MTAGLYSMAMAIQSASQDEQERRKRMEQYRTTAQELMLKKRPENLSSEENELLDTIENQIAMPYEPSGTDCPSCEEPMRTIRLKECDIEACPSCESIWFEAGDLSILMDRGSDIPGEYLQSRESQYQCPVCGEQMQEHVFKHFSTLLVDQCPKHHGVFLEKGELARALAET